MNIFPVPPAGLASLAGTQRAAAKGADLDQAAAAEAARQRADHPGGDSGDVSEIERDAAAGDSGADGRQAYQHSEPDEEDSRQRDDANPAASPPGDDATSDNPSAGQHLDLKA